MNNNRLYDKYKKRLNIFSAIIFSLTLIVIFNFFIVQVIFSNSYTDEISVRTKSYQIKEGKRGAIFDRNNELLAYSIEKCRFWINSNNDINKKEIFNFVSNFSNKKLSFKESYLEQKSNYLIILDDLIAYEHDDLIEQSKSIKSLNCDYYNHRLYPYNELAAQLIGFTNYDNQGKYGIEGYFNHILDGSKSRVEYNKNSRGRRVSSQNSLLPNDGSDIFLTIDINIQDILQHELKEVFLNNNAKSANGIIINPYNGEIIAMASIPDFNLNDYRNLPSDSANYYYTNRVISAPYEPGSTFKIVCFSEALDSNKNKDDKYFCENGHYIGKYQQPFRDHDPYDSLSFSNIFTYSSNIGTIKIFETLSKESFYKKMQDFGFGIASNISLKDESAGDIKSINYYNNNLRDLASASIGQSILVTNLQMALAYSSIANGGYLLKPKIVKKIINNDFVDNFDKPIIVRKNLKTETSNFLITNLNQAINKGTGKKAYISEIEIGGKTGTAEIWDKKNKEYSKKNYFSSFATIFPIHEPKYVMIISIEAPENYNKRWGGETAAPCAKNIIKNILLYDKELRIKKNEKA